MGRLYLRRWLRIGSPEPGTKMPVFALKRRSARISKKFVSRGYEGSSIFLQEQALVSSRERQWRTSPDYSRRDTMCWNRQDGMLSGTACLARRQSPLLPVPKSMPPCCEPSRCLGSAEIDWFGSARTVRDE